MARTTTTTMASTTTTTTAAVTPAEYICHPLLTEAPAEGSVVYFTGKTVPSNSCAYQYLNSEAGGHPGGHPWLILRAKGLKVLCLQMTAFSHGQSFTARAKSLQWSRRYVGIANHGTTRERHPAGYPTLSLQAGQGQMRSDSYANLEQFVEIEFGHLRRLADKPVQAPMLKGDDLKELARLFEEYTPETRANTKALQDFAKGVPVTYTPSCRSSGPRTWTPRETPSPPKEEKLEWRNSKRQASPELAPRTKKVRPGTSRALDSDNWRQQRPL